jgi:hypothetical protein
MGMIDSQEIERKNIALLLIKVCHNLSEHHVGETHEASMSSTAIEVHLKHTWNS